MSAHLKQLNASLFGTQIRYKKYQEKRFVSAIQAKESSSKSKKSYTSRA